MLRSVYQTGRRAIHRMANVIDRPVVVLVYHSVGVVEEDPYSLFVSPENFRGQMDYLKKNFPVLRFEEDWSRRQGPSVVVTFDDGYANNVSVALPILEEAGIAGTFFVTTGWVGSGGEFWWDEVAHLIGGQGAFPELFELQDDRYGRSWVTASLEARRSFREELASLIKRIELWRREEWLGQLRSWAGRSGSMREAHRAMSLEELRVLGRCPLATVGAHGVTHTALAAISVSEQREELSRSKAQLEEWLGDPVSVFAYPYGDRSCYSRDSVRLCRELGFVRAAAGGFGGQAHRWTDAHQIPRHMVLDWPVETFAGRLSEFWAS